MVYKVEGYFKIKFAQIVEAKDPVKAEELAARQCRRELRGLTTIEGRPFDVSVEEVDDAETNM